MIRRGRQSSPTRIQIMPDGTRLVNIELGQLNFMNVHETTTLTTDGSECKSTDRLCPHKRRLGSARRETPINRVKTSSTPQPLTTVIQVAPRELQPPEEIKELEPRRKV
jgi:hypothetical protein